MLFDPACFGRLRNLIVILCYLFVAYDNKTKGFFE